MRERRDALQGACLFVTRAHEQVRENYPDGAFNCGNLEVIPGSTTIIPHQVCLTIEFRNPHETELDQMRDDLYDIAQECAEACHLTVDIQPVNNIAAALIGLQGD